MILFVDLYGIATAPTDNAMGAFSFINMVIYAVFAIILTVHRNTVSMNAVPLSQYKNSSDYDPTINEDYEEEQV